MIALGTFCVYMKIKWISRLNEESGDLSRLFESIFKKIRRETCIRFI